MAVQKGIKLAVGTCGQISVQQPLFHWWQMKGKYCNMGLFEWLK